MRALSEQSCRDVKKKITKIENVSTTLFFDLGNLGIKFQTNQPLMRTDPGKSGNNCLSSVKKVRRYGQIVRFLIASALYRDGLATLFAVGGLYAAGTFGMSFEQILIFAIGLNVTAGLGAAGFAFADDKFGSKPTILIALAGLIGFGIPLLLVSAAEVFIALALCIGLFVGPAQAASRTLMSRLAPDDMETEMFGLYAFTGKAAVFLGPLAFGLATEAFASQRAGMATIVLFLAAGGALLWGVREPGHHQGISDLS